jgi:hypothetical protein
MKSIFVCWICFFCLLSSASAQFKYPKETNPVHQYSFGFGLVASPILGKTYWGFGADIKYMPNPKWGTGLNMLVSQRKISEKYDYNIGQPIVEYLELGWVNHYEFYASKKFRVNFNLNNGLIASELADNSIKVYYRTRYGTNSRPKPIVTSFYYLIEPGLEVNRRLSSWNSSANIYLTAQAKYRMAFGKGKFGSDYGYNGYLLSLGITMYSPVWSRKKN